MEPTDEDRKIWSTVSTELSLSYFQEIIKKGSDINGIQITYIR